MQQRVPHPCTRARVTKQPRSQGSLLREEKLIHPRNGGFIIPLSPDPNITPSPYQAIFSRGANALSGRRKGREEYLPFIIFPRSGQARLAHKASSSRSRTFTFLGPEFGWPLRPAAATAAAADPEAGAVCRHGAALGWGQRTNSEGQGEGSFEIIYKHITKFHYFCFADSSTQEYKSS